MKTPKALTHTEKLAYQIFERGLLEVAKAAQTFDTTTATLEVGGADSKFSDMLHARAEKAQKALEELMEDL